MAKEVFEQFLEKNNLDIKVIESQGKTHTAQQAADAHGIPVRNIVKSILVKIDNEFFLFLVPGNKKVDLEEKKREFNAKNITIANPQEVKNITGYSIGGVPPFGHRQKIKTFIEKGFDEKENLLAAAGSPKCVFEIGLREMRTIIDNI